jgi:hypothetical protein
LILKYWAPINSPGGINGNDPYVNGNPSIGVQGSIPTFQSFEQTLRGLQNLVLKSALNPDATIDDLQITQAVRSQWTNWTQLFGGTNNALIATFDPAPTSLASIIGMPIRGLIRFNNTGPATLTTNNLLEKPITHPDGTPLVADDFVAGAIVGLMYDGTKYQFIEGWGRGGAGTTPPPGTTAPPATGCMACMGGYSVLTQPFFFAYTYAYLPRLVGIYPGPYAIVNSNLGDAVFNTAMGQLTTGPNTQGNWLFSVVSVPQTTLTNKLNMTIWSNSPVYTFYGIAASNTADTNWADGYSNHITMSAIVNLPSGKAAYHTQQAQYDTSNYVAIAGIRVSGGPVIPV